MSVTRLSSGIPQFLTLRLACCILLESINDRLLGDDEALAVTVETMAGSRPRRRMQYALRPLLEDGVVEQVDDGGWRSTNDADLAAWIADGFADRQDAGINDSPTTTIPAPRRAAAA